MKLPQIYIFTFILSLLSFNTYSTPLSEEDLATQREIFLKAEHALKLNDYATYDRLTQKIVSYPLFPYLIYEEFKKEIQSLPPDERTLIELRNFQNAYPDFPLTANLQNLWLRQTIKHKNWPLFVKYYQNSDDPELQCHYYNAQFKLTGDTIYLEQAEPLWLVGYSSCQACEQLFNAWKKFRPLSNELLWQKMILAIEHGNTTLVKQLTSELPKTERPWVHQWEKLIHQPFLLTKEKTLSSLSAPDKIKLEMLSYVLKLLAQQDADEALAWWQSHGHKFVFSGNQIKKIQRNIALHLALQKSSQAESWFSHVPDQALDSVTLEWRVRNSLFNQDWKNAIKWINRLPATLKTQKEWQYWLARSYEKTHSEAQAREIYTKLASIRSYYGFLSSYRLQKPVSIQDHPLHVSPEQLKNIANHPAIIRSIELRHVHKAHLSRTEWFRAVDNMNENEILSAAKLAQKMGLFDYAIFTIGRSEYKDDIHLRFPLGFEEDVLVNATQHNLDPSWVFAIIRQESAFFTDSLSSAGARGLMQLLPSTAKDLSKKYDLSYENERSLHHPAINIQIGTVYLKNLKLMMLDNIILASASYNAGPTRTATWLPSAPLEADIWIETLPYKETREYVKNVLTYTNIYRHRLGYASSFALMLKPIPTTVKNS